MRTVWFYLGKALNYRLLQIFVSKEGILKKNTVSVNKKQAPLEVGPCWGSAKPLVGTSNGAGIQVILGLWEIKKWGKFL